MIIILPQTILSNRQKVRNFQIPSLINRNHVILYKNGNIPLKPILDYLKSVEQEMVEKFVTSGYNNILYDLEETKTKDKNVISIAEIASRNDIPLEKHLESLEQFRNKAVKIFVILKRPITGFKITI